MACQLTSVAKVNSYLGLTSDSDRDILISDMIDSVSEYIEGYVDSSFCNDIYTERTSFTDGLVLTRNNIQFVYGVFAGTEEVISVVGPNVRCSVSITLADGVKNIRLINGLSTTSIDASALTLSGTASAINAISGWDATYTGSKDLYALCLYDGDFSLDTALTLKLQGSVEKVDVAQISNRILNSGVCCNVGHIIYQGGYAVVPTDVEDAVTRIVGKAYNDRSSGTSGDIKSEKVGDWSATYMTFNESSGGGSLSINYFSVFDKYKNFSV